MSYIPSDSDLAIKTDLDALGNRLESHMERFDDKLDGFHTALRDQARTYVLTMTGVMAAFASVVVAAGILN